MITSDLVVDVDVAGECALPHWGRKTSGKVGEGKWEKGEGRREKAEG